ncbi:MAG: phosphotransferase [Planctomycetaceae bacterium]|nr:phosphotransferase [Planctomycetaceae bacterium]
MKLTSIPQIYRHVGRWYEILEVLSKYGVAAWVGRLGPDFAKDLLKARGGGAIARHPWETRLRMAMAELGPTFIKLGQMLSTRPDLVGVRLAEEFQHLQANVPADSSALVHKLIESEFGRPTTALFAHFEPEAMASASIGQVHRARLHTGEAVVVKVLHADIERKVAVDMDILAGLALMAEMVPEFRNYRPQAIVAEFHRAMRRELDFGREERNIQQFAHDFARDPTVHIPKTYPALCSRRVLTMELLEGIKLSEGGRLAAAGIDTEEIARRGAAICLKMIFDNGFYHADPHPGNLLVMEQSRIGLLDFGMVGRIDERLHEALGEMLVALGNFDAEHMTAMILRLGKAPSDLDRSALTLDVADFLSYYASQSLDRFDLSGALNEIMEQIRRYQIMLPARIVMLLKALITLEGTARQISPKFSLVEMIRPYRKKLVWRRFSPRRRLRKLHRLYSELEHLVDILPQGIADVLEQMQGGRFDIHLDHRGLEPSVNRLVLGLLASSLFVGSAMLLSFKVPPPLFGISAPGLAAAVVSVALGLRLWRAISKSGHLDRKKRD